MSAESQGNSWSPSATQLDLEQADTRDYDWELRGAFPKPLRPVDPNEPSCCDICGSDLEGEGNTLLICDQVVNETRGMPQYCQACTHQGTARAHTQHFFGHRVFRMNVEAVSYKRPACSCGVTLDDTVCGFVRSVPEGDWRCDLHKDELRRISTVSMKRVR